MYQDPHDLRIDSTAEYHINAGSFDSDELDALRPRRGSSSSPVSSPYYLFTSFLSRFRYRYLSLVAALPLPAFLKGRSHAHSPIPLHHISEAATSSLSAIALSQSVSSEAKQAADEAESDMQALLKKV